MNRIKKLRKERRLTLDQLEKMTGINHASINNYELGLREPSLQRCERLAEFFNVTPQYLVGWSDERH